MLGLSGPFYLADKTLAGLMRTHTFLPFQATARWSIGAHQLLCGNKVCCRACSGDYCQSRQLSADVGVVGPLYFWTDWSHLLFSHWLHIT